MLYQMFFVSNDVVRLLKKSLENFSKNGLTTVQGVNVVFRIKYILTAFGRLSKLRQLRIETLTHILSLLKLFSVEKFKQPSGLYLNQDKINDTFLSVGLDNTSEYTLVQVRSIYIEAIPSYNSL